MCHVLVLLESLMLSPMRLCVCIYNKSKGFSPQLGEWQGFGSVQPVAEFAVSGQAAWRAVGQVVGTWFSKSTL